ncbi:MAG: hypothetical protein AAGI14_02675 [Pseudomonadota bacterium]
MKSITFKLFASTVLLALSLRSTALAESENKIEGNDFAVSEQPLNEWVLSTSLGTFDGFDAGDAADVSYARTRVEARFDDGTAVFFNCLTASNAIGESIFDAAVNLDTSKDEFKKNLRWQFVSGRLSVGDRKKNYRWKMNPANMILAPVQNEAARRLLNGVIKGDTVSLRVFGDTYINRALPKMNDDFKAFYRDCPALAN